MAAAAAREQQLQAQLQAREREIVALQRANRTLTNEAAEAREGSPDPPRLHGQVEALQAALRQQASDTARAKSELRAMQRAAAQVVEEAQGAQLREQQLSAAAEQDAALLAQLRQEVARLQQEQRQAIQQARQAAEAESEAEAAASLAAARAEATEACEEMEALRERLTTEHRDAVGRHQKEKEEALRHLTEGNELAVAQMSEQHASVLSAMRTTSASHSEAVEALRSDHAAALASAQGDVAACREEAAASRQRLEAEHEAALAREQAQHRAHASAAEERYASELAQRIDFVEKKGLQALSHERALHESAVVQVRAEAEAQLQAAASEHEISISALQAEHAEVVASAVREDTEARQQVLASEDTARAQQSVEMELMRARLAEALSANEASTLRETDQILAFSEAATSAHAVSLRTADGAHEDELLALRDHLTALRVQHAAALRDADDKRACDAVVTAELRSTVATLRSELAAQSEGSPQLDARLALGGATTLHEQGEEASAARAQETIDSLEAALKSAQAKEEDAELAAEATCAAVKMESEVAVATANRRIEELSSELETASRNQGQALADIVAQRDANALALSELQTELEQSKAEAQNEVAALQRLGEAREKAAQEELQALWKHAHDAGLSADADAKAAAARVRRLQMQLKVATDEGAQAEQISEEAQARAAAERRRLQDTIRELDEDRQKLNERWTAARAEMVAAHAQELERMQSLLKVADARVAEAENRLLAAMQGQQSQRKHGLRVVHRSSGDAFNADVGAIATRLVAGGLDPHDAQVWDERRGRLVALSELLDAEALGTLSADDAGELATALGLALGLGAALG